MENWLTKGIPKEIIDELTQFGLRVMGVSESNHNGRVTYVETAYLSVVEQKDVINNLLKLGWQKGFGRVINGKRQKQLYKNL
jgi:hypothetical protein